MTQELREWYLKILPENISSLPEVQEEYIDFLRGLFKGTLPMRYTALAYLTGIFPVKKFKTQSALNNFDEFTKLSSGEFAPYIGFTEEEVLG